MWTKRKALLAGTAATVLALAGLGFTYGYRQHAAGTPVTWFDFDVVYVDGRPGFELRMHRTDWDKIAAKAGPVRDPLQNDGVNRLLTQMVEFGIKERGLPCPKNFVVYKPVSVGSDVAFDGLCASKQELESLYKDEDGGYHII